MKTLKAVLVVLFVCVVAFACDYTSDSNLNEHANHDCSDHQNVLSVKVNPDGFSVYDVSGNEVTDIEITDYISKKIASEKRTKDFRIEFICNENVQVETKSHTHNYAIYLGSTFEYHTHWWAPLKTCKKTYKYYRCTCGYPQTVITHEFI